MRQGFQNFAEFRVRVTINGVISHRQPRQSAGGTPVKARLCFGSTEGTTPVADNSPSSFGLIIYLFVIDQGTGCGRSINDAASP